MGGSEDVLGGDQGPAAERSPPEGTDETDLPEVLMMMMLKMMMMKMMMMKMMVIIMMITTCQGYLLASLSWPPTILALIGTPLLTPHWHVPGAREI